jgi:predicted ABC-type ATPase
MQPSDRQLPYLLSDQENSTIYALIRNDLLESLKPSELKNPMAFFTAGSPGSGKTALRNHLLDSNFQSSTLVINTDELREYHPSYKELLAHPTNYASAPYLVNPDSVKWAEQLRKDGISGRYNLLFDVTLGGSPDHYIKSMQDLKALNYKVFIAVLAVKSELSRLGIHLRYERQFASERSGRFVNMNVHDANYNNLTKNLIEIMKVVELDAVAVYKRKVFEHNNQLVNNTVESIIGSDKRPKDYDSSLYIDVIIKAIDEERNRPWTELEKEYLKMRIEQVEELLKNRGADLSVFREDIKPIFSAIGEGQYRSRGV